LEKLSIEPSKKKQSLVKKLEQATLWQEVIEIIKETPEQRFRVDFKDVLTKLIEIKENKSTEILPSNSIFSRFLQTDTKNSDSR